jgi:hypothetical protein
MSLKNGFTSDIEEEATTRRLTHNHGIAKLFFGDIGPFFTVVIGLPGLLNCVNFIFGDEVDTTPAPPSSC